MADIDWAQVGERIRDKRTALGLSQKDLAEPDYSPAFISLVEAGSRRASAESLDHLAAKLNTDRGHLLHGHPEGNEGKIALALQRARIEGRTGDPEAGREHLEHCRVQARTYRLHLLEAKANEYLGAAAERIDDLAAAARYYEEASELYRDEPAHLRFAAVAGRARLANLQGEVRFAIHLLESYLLELQRDGLEGPTALMRTYSGLVAAYSMAGLRKEAADAADRALALGTRVEDPEQIACMNLNVANNLLARGRVADALQATTRAEDAFGSLGWQLEVASCQHNRALLLADQGDLDGARAGLLAALEHRRDGACPAHDVANTLNELARVERLRGDETAACRCLDQALPYLGAADPMATAEHRRESGLLMDDPDQREAALTDAARLFLETDAAHHASATLTMVGDLRAEAGDFEAAAQAYRDALEAANRH
jgi:transcriptional regulator with XRE-family HTH domain